MKRHSDGRRYKIILASNSPRRRELLSGLDLDYVVKVIPGIEEAYPHDLPAKNIPEFIAKEKAEPYIEDIEEDELILTADTVVIVDGMILGKPASEVDAKNMLRMLSGKTHQVVTGVCLTTKTIQRSFSVSTDVTFKNLCDSEIDYYVRTYHPMDKAGAYGIQEWIGYVGVTSLNGSYYNVMGLPVQRIWEELKKMERYCEI